MRLPCGDYARRVAGHSGLVETGSGDDDEDASDSSDSSDSSSGEEADRPSARKASPGLVVCRCWTVANDFLHRCSCAVRVLFAFLLLAAAIAVWMRYTAGRVDETFAYSAIGSFLGIAPGLLRRRPDKPAVPPKGIRRHVYLVGATSLTIMLAIFPWCKAGSFQHPIQRRIALINLLSSLAMLPVLLACIGARHPPSKYVRDAVWCVVALWVVTLLWTLGTDAGIVWPKGALAEGGAGPVGVGAPPPSTTKNLPPPPLAPMTILFVSAAMHLEGVAFTWIAVMIARRLRAFRRSTTSYAEHSDILIVIMSIAFHCKMWSETLAPFYLHRHSSVMTAYTCLTAVFLTIFVLYTATLARCLASGFLLMRRESISAHGAPQAEAKWAANVLGCEFAACLSLGLTAMTTWVLKLVVMFVFPPGKMAAGEPPWWLDAMPVVHRCDYFANSVALAMLSGLVWQAKRPNLKAFAVGCVPPARSSTLSNLPGDSTPASFSGDDLLQESVWDAKVRELAYRGVRLGDLLELWRRLLAGELMPSFDPRRSTTNDVVRQAIIPLSLTAEGVGGRALASVWSDEPRLAMCMVTHNWSNLFWHLIAAIVADELDEPTYAEVADVLLDEGKLAGLRGDLDRLDRLSRTFWICAFSVNQHAGICGGFGPEPALGTQEHAEWDAKRRDTSTQAILPLCRCQQPKVFSDQPDACEMNKFVDMMRFMASRQQGRFSHLAVVDAGFEVFSRAWCVAEIVESHVTEMPMRIKIHSEEMLDRHYCNLMNLDVRNCRATRAEDKAMILKAIPDIDVFNSALTWAIFGTEGLFSQWFDGQERASLVGRIVQRARLASDAANSASGRVGRGRGSRGARANSDVSTVAS